jgi:hypothetical protein
MFLPRVSKVRFGVELSLPEAAALPQMRAPDPCRDRALFHFILTGQQNPPKSPITLAPACGQKATRGVELAADRGGMLEMPRLPPNPTFRFHTLLQALLRTGWKGDPAALRAAIHEWADRACGVPDLHLKKSAPPGPQTRGSASERSANPGGAPASTVSKEEK